MQSIQNLPATTQHRTVLDMKITRFEMVPSGRYRTQHYRPLTMHVSNESLASLGNNLDQAGGRVDAMDMNSFAAKTLQFSADTISPVAIPNGWDTERYAFELQVLVTTTAGTVIERLVGWTEHADRSFGGNNDENMMFVVNSVSKQRLNTQTGPSGTYNTFSMVNSSHVFFEPDHQISYNNETTPKLVRPYDIYGRLAIDSLDPSGSWARDMGTGMGGPGTYLDARGSITGAVETSRRANGLLGNYLQRTLSAYATAEQARNAGMSERSYADFASVFSDARKSGSIREVPISESDFLVKINNSRYFTTAVEPKFTLADIYALDPALRGADPRFIINEVGLVTSPFSSAEWNSASHEALAACYLTHSIPAIMAKSGASGLSVILQNMYDTMPMVMVTGSQETHRHYIPLIEQTIANEVMPILTMNNQRSIDCKYICKALSYNTEIRISINGGPEALFEVPQFADARFSPMITSEMGAADLTSVLSATMQSLGVSVSTNFGEPTAMDLDNMASLQVSQNGAQTPSIFSGPTFSSNMTGSNSGGMSSLEGLFGAGGSGSNQPLM